MTMNTEEKDKNEYRINEKLMEKQRKQLLRLLENYKDIFVKDKNELGKCGIVKHRIDTGDTKPIKQRAYRASGENKKLIEEENFPVIWFKNIDKIADGSPLQKSLLAIFDPAQNYSWDCHCDPRLCRPSARPERGHLRTKVLCPRSQ